MPAEILIAVFEGISLDAVELQNAAIYVKYEDGEQRLYHLAGTNPLFKWMIHNACASTPIQNAVGNDRNSQNWVAGALSSLVRIGCMSEVQRLNAVNCMIDACRKVKV
ncbi:hypothetical protein PENSUB_447 [Penicillium subrubescens]|uniref:Uncharacterized protein n=1 Tax=Penicillium subrubescens TaxID=1316194 RepID=A0A1Q5UN28_9EURO|nr:hypothetical protein PENSUB_447 [Penicillium subrubescens]